MVIQIRGTSGSGKSHTVRELMKRYESKPLFQEFSNKPMGYRLSNGLHIVGRYETPCGGCDTIAKQDEVCARVSLFARAGNVLFEGLLASGTVGRYISLANELAPEPFVFAFLDTPLEKCLQNVKARRAERGDDREFNPENTKERYEAIQRAKEKLTAAGMDVRDLDHQYAADMIQAWLPTAVAGAAPKDIFNTPRQAGLF